MRRFLFLLIILPTGYSCSSSPQKKDPLLGFWLCEKHDLPQGQTGVATQLRWEFMNSITWKKNVFVDHNNSDTERFDYSVNGDTLTINRHFGSHRSYEHDGKEVYLIGELNDSTLNLSIKDSVGITILYFKKVESFY